MKAIQNVWMSDLILKFISGTGIKFLMVPIQKTDEVVPAYAHYLAYSETLQRIRYVAPFPKRAFAYSQFC